MKARKKKMGKNKKHLGHERKMKNSSKKGKQK